MTVGSVGGGGGGGKLLKTLYDREREVAISAVIQASIITRHLSTSLKLSIDNEQKHSNDQTTITKTDNSPVTIGDFTVQGLINLLISKKFPNDRIIAEESSKDLIKSNKGTKITTTDQDQIRSKVLETLNFGLNQTRLDVTEDEWNWKDLRSLRLNQTDWMSVIDHGNVCDEDYVGSEEEFDERFNRFWTLDPIDGTKGFLRGQQYSICLSLIINGRVQLGVIAAPNLPIHSKIFPGDCPDQDRSDTGLVFVAERDQGTYQRTFDSGELRRLSMNENDCLESLINNNGRFCESYESSHSDHSLTSRIISTIGLKDHQPIRVDSQVKYCLISRGDGDIYLRYPTRSDYHEKIWDHAPGSIIVEEAGGRVSDFDENYIQI
ncbi:hypothetical protein BY996DRAFT_2760393 [Phakopsora pachyrhizi]|nr:hypothetical protein BY996DRAFT_2760393 [Phakopsora pachyrhizi]